MSKISTEDCVKYLTTKVSIGSSPKDWKRRSKVAWNGGTMRLFENIKTGSKQEIYERDGVILGHMAPDPTETPVTPVEDTTEETSPIGGFQLDPEVVKGLMAMAKAKGAKKELTEADFVSQLERTGSGPWTLVQKIPVAGDTLWQFSKPTGSGLAMLVEMSEKKVRQMNDAKSASEVNHDRVAYYAIAKGDEGQTLLYVGDIGVFDTEHRHSDETPRGTFEELKWLGFEGAELQEGVVEFFTEPNVAELKAALKKSRLFKFSQAFEDFMQESDNEESTVIPLESIKEGYDWSDFQFTISQQPDEDIELTIGIPDNVNDGGNVVVTNKVEEICSEVGVECNEVMEFVWGIGEFPEEKLREVKAAFIAAGFEWDPDCCYAGREFVLLSDDKPKDEVSIPSFTVENPASDWDKIKANPIKVDLTKPSKMKSRWSGRVIFDVGEIEEDQISFYCGPELKDGYLEDTDDGGTETALRDLFADFGETMGIGSAEMFHEVDMIKGVDPKELWAVIKDRLVRSGAVQMKKHDR